MANKQVNPLQEWINRNTTLTTKNTTPTKVVIELLEHVRDTGSVPAGTWIFEKEQ